MKSSWKKTTAKVLLVLVILEAVNIGAGLIYNSTSDNNQTIATSTPSENAAAAAVRAGSQCKNMRTLVGGIIAATMSSSQCGGSSNVA